MKNWKIINIIIIACVIIGLFFLVKFDVMGKLYDTIEQEKSLNKSTKEKDDVQGETIHKTVLDEDGNEIVIEMKKRIVLDEYGNEVEMYTDTAETIIIWESVYKGRVTKIDDNKIYFNVDLEEKKGTKHSFKNVDNYEIIFDIDTYVLEYDPKVRYSVHDFLLYNSKHFYKAEELQNIVGDYLRISDTGFEDNYTGENYKILCFWVN